MKKYLSVLGVLISLFFVSNIVYSESKTEQNVKMLFESNFAMYKDREDGKGARISSWDINDAGGRILSAAYLQMQDISEEFPLEATRRFEAVNSGNVTAEFKFACSDSMENGGFAIRSGVSEIVSLTMHNGILYLGNTDITPVMPHTDYVIRLDMDFDSGSIKVYVNGKLSGEGEFTLPQNGIDNFFMTSGDIATGDFVLKNARMYTGYTLIDDFDTSNVGVWWSVYKNNTLSGEKYTNTLSSSDAETSLKTEFEALNVPFVVEFNMLQPTKREMEFCLWGDNKTAVVFGSTGEDFFCGDEVIYEDYLENMWYTLRLLVYPQTKTADVYLNGKLKKSNISFSNKTVTQIDSAEFFLIQSSGDVTVDNVKIYPYETFSDYVPEPQKVTSPNVTIGMQQCPLWHEGVRWGNDWLMDSEVRMPILGIFDENTPEAMDWSIKYMAEHGVDFQWICLDLHGNIDAPRNPALLTDMIHNAYFYAKYSDIINFAILWENAAVNNWTSDAAKNREMFLKYTVPFWIEHYFKDERYQTVGGRPLLGIYQWQAFKTNFGTAEEVSAMIKAMGDMCEEAGVGRPYVILGTYLVDVAGWAFDLFKSYGIDASYSYNMGTNWADTQMSYHSTGISAASSRDYDYIPTITMGYDVNVWNGAPGIKITPADFDAYMTAFSANIIPSLENIEGEKPIVMAGSWNEFTEGHYFMPSEKEGFSYIDSIRKYLVGNSEVHNDAAPTASQKERINNMYPSGRKTPLVEKYYPETVPSDVTILKKWDFTVKNDVNSWTAVDDSATVSYNQYINKSMKLTPSAENAVIECSDINLDITASPYIRINISKNATSAETVTIWYTTDAYPEYSNERQIKRYIKNKTEIIIPIGMYVQSWYGNLKNLKIGFGPVTSTGYTKYINLTSLEILSTQQEDVSYIYIGDKRYENMSSIEQDYIPMSELAKYTGDSVFVNNGNVVYKRRNGGAVIKISEDGYSINNAKIGDLEDWYISDGELYASVSTAETIIGRSVSLTGDDIYVQSQGMTTGISYIVSSSPANGTKEAPVTDTVKLTLFKTPQSVDNVIIEGGSVEVTGVSVSDNSVVANVLGMEAGEKYKMSFEGINFGTFTTDEYLEFTTKISPSEVFSYEFDRSNHLHWGGNYYSIENTHGNLNINAKAGKSPYLYMNGFSAPSSDIKYMDICVKSDNKIKGKVYFKTSNSNSIAEDKTFTYNIEAGKRQLISIPVSNHSLWTGNVTQLRLDFGSSPTDNCISVDYVRLRGESALSDGWICTSHMQEEIDGNEIINMDSVYNNTSEEKELFVVSAVYDGERLKSVKSQSATVAPYDSGYAAVVKEPFGRVFVWDKGTLLPICNKFSARPEREKIKTWEFNTAGNREGWGSNGWMYGISSATVENGVINISHPSGDPSIYSDYLSIDTTKIKCIEVGIQSDKPYKGKFYFSTSTANSLSETRTFTFDVEQTKCVRKYVIDTSSNSEWTGNLTRLRLDFADKLENNIKVDYIRLLGDFEE